MSSNYPPGVSDDSYGAPFNEEEREFEFYVKVSGYLYADGPLSRDLMDDAFVDALVETKREITDFLTSNFSYDFEITDV